MAVRNPNLDQTGKSWRQKAPLSELPRGVSWCEVGNGHGGKFIRVRFGKKFTGQKPAFVRNYPDKTAAQRGIEDEGEKQPAQVLELTPTQLSEAKAALAILAGKVSLVTAANFWVAKEGKVGAPKPLREVIDEHVAALKLRSGSKSYPEAQRRACEEILKGQEKILIGEVTAEKLEAIRKKRQWEALNWRNHLRDWRMLFKFAAHPRRRYILDNPVDLIDAPLVETEVEIYKPSAALRLCETALVLNDDILAFVAVGLFSGVRVEEMARMDFTLFDWDRKLINLGPNEVKSSGRKALSIPRAVPISDQLMAWLDLVERRKGPFQDKNFRRRWDRTKDVASLAWPDEEFSPFAPLKNGMRHSFASHHYVECGDAAKTRELLGQKSEGTFWKHYFHFVSKPEAEEYKAILPPSPERLAVIRPMILASATQADLAIKDRLKAQRMALRLKKGAA